MMMYPRCGENQWPCCGLIRQEGRQNATKSITIQTLLWFMGVDKEEDEEDEVDVGRMVDKNDDEHDDDVE